jgi:hypothetical protein
MDNRTGETFTPGRTALKIGDGIIRSKTMSLKRAVPCRDYRGFNRKAAEYSFVQDLKVMLSESFCDPHKGVLGNMSCIA